MGMSSAKRWAVAADATLRGNPPPKPAKAAPAKSKPARQAVQENVDATPERIKQAEGLHKIVDANIDKAGEKARLTRRFVDSWVDRLAARGLLTTVQHHACVWYGELHAAAMSAPRVVAGYGEGTGGSGCECYGQPANRHQWDARRRLRAVRAVIPTNMLTIVDMVIVEDRMPSFANGRQRERFAERFAKAVDPIGQHISA